MRRIQILACIVGVLCLGALAIPAHAVQLQSGWYAQFGYVGMGAERWDTDPPQAWAEGWTPTSQLGQHGQLLVEEPDPVAPGSRRITVMHDFNAEPGVIYEDYGEYPGAYPYYSWVNVWWQTNYDANRLQLQLFRRHQGQPDVLVWRQRTSNPAIGHGDVWRDSPLQAGEQVVFRLVVLPEPQGFVVMGAGMTLGLALIRRRRAK